MGFWNSTNAFEFFSSFLRKHQTTDAELFVSYIGPKFKENFESYTNPGDATVVSTCNICLSVYFPQGGFIPRGPRVKVSEVSAFRGGKANPETNDLSTTPDKKWKEMDADTRDKIEDLFEELGIDDFLDEITKIEGLLLQDIELSQLGTKTWGSSLPLSLTRSSTIMLGCIIQG